MEDALRDLYQEVILDHGKHPRNLRHPAGANRQARGYNPLCGDQVTIYLETDKDGRIADVAFEGKGCAISIASASMMTEAIRGQSEERARELFGADHARLAWSSMVCRRGTNASFPKVRWIIAPASSARWSRLRMEMASVFLARAVSPRRRSSTRLCSPLRVSTMTIGCWADRAMTG